MKQRIFSLVISSVKHGDERQGYRCLDCEPQFARGIPVVNLAENIVRKVDPVDAPAALRRHFGGSIVEVLIVRLKESIVDAVEIAAEKLLRVIACVRRGVRPEQ